MKDKNELTAKLTDLLETLQKETQEIVTGPALQVHDLSLAYNHMFSAAAKKGMERKVTTQIVKREIVTVSQLSPQFAVDKVEYFSCIANGKEKLYKAARMVADNINRYAARGYVTGTLAPLSCIELCREPHELERYAVYCFVAMTQAGSTMAKNDTSGICTVEGAISQVEV